MTTATVDVHAHALFPQSKVSPRNNRATPEQRELDLRGSGAESAAINQQQLAQIGPLLTDPAQRLAAMDRARVDVQVVSPMPLYHYWADASVAQRSPG